MMVLAKPHEYSRYMLCCNLKSDEWMNMLNSPLVRDDKHKAPLFIWGKSTGIVEIDNVSRHARCIGGNIAEISALQLDYDDGISAAEWMRTYDNLKYCLYTSYNYGFKPNDRFRVVIPLAEPFPMSYHNYRSRKMLSDMFPHCDRSCFDWGHFQLVPVVRSKDAPYHFVMHEGGERLFLDNEKLRLMSLEVAEEKRIRERDKNWTVPAVGAGSSAAVEGALRWAQQKIDQCMPGERNESYFRILHWLRNHDICEFDARQLYVAHDMRNEFDRMIDRIW